MNENVTPEQEDAKLQKRINPLKLETAAGQTPAPAPQEKKPTQILGKPKKKLTIVSVNKDLLAGAIEATGKDAADAIDAALLIYLFTEYPDAYKKVKRALAEKGCEIK